MEIQEYTDVKKKKVWFPSQELLLKKWCEICASYRYLHDRSRDVYRKRVIAFQIPIILFSVITGAVSFSTGNYPEQYKDVIPIVLGSINILTAIISALTQFLKNAELYEGHRVASIAFSKLSRSISVELNLPPKERNLSGRDFLNQCRQEFDRLLEQSPNIPIDILNEFQKKFEDKDFNKPDIMTVESVSIYEQKPGSVLPPNDPDSPAPSNNHHSAFPSALPSRRNSVQNHDLPPNANKDFEIPEHIEKVMKRGPEQIVEGIEKIVPSSRMEDFRKATRVASALARHLPVSIQKSLPLNVAPSGPENPIVQASFVPLTEIVSLPGPEPPVPSIAPPVPPVEPPVPPVEPPAQVELPPVEPPAQVELPPELNEAELLPSVTNPFSEQTLQERKIDSTAYLEKMHEGVFDIPDDALLC